MKMAWFFVGLSLLIAIGCQRAEAPVDAQSVTMSNADTDVDVTEQLNAHTVLDKALAEAKASDKSVFIHFKTDT